MYAGDHIILSAMYGVYAARKIRLPPLAVVVTAIAVNMMDFDHQIFYYLDDGTANSLTLHPLHIYAGCFIFALNMLWLHAQGKTTHTWRKVGDYSLIALGGIALHLTADALAWSFRYDMPLMLCISIINVALFIYMCRGLRPFLGSKLSWQFCGFFIGWLFISDFQLVLFEYVLNIHAPESRWVFFPGPVFMGLAALSAWGVFRKTTLAKPL
jgi:hypothetical protein